MLLRHTMRTMLAGVLLSGGIAAVGVGMAAHADAAGPTGPFKWCPGQPLPKVDVIWDNNVCHTYYYVYPEQGNVGDGHGGGINNVWDGPNPPTGPAPAGPISHKWCPGQPLPDDGTNLDGTPHTFGWDMNVCHTYYVVGYQQGNVGDYIWDAAGGPPPPPPQCPPIAFMCP
jgi:hypothetical protein